MSDKFEELMKALKDVVIARLRIQKQLGEAHVRFEKACEEGRDDVIELSRQELMSIFEAGIDQVIASYKRLDKLKALTK